MIGLPVIRLKGHYMAMASLGFGLIIYRIVLGGRNLRPGGWHLECAPFRIFAGLEVNGRAAFRIESYYIAWFVVLAAMTLAINLVHSRSRQGASLYS